MKFGSCYKLPGSHPVHKSILIDQQQDALMFLARLCSDSLCTQDMSTVSAAEYLFVKYNMFSMKIDQLFSLGFATLSHQGAIVLQAHPLHKPAVHTAKICHHMRDFHVKLLEKNL